MIKKGNTSFQELRNPRSGYFRPSDMAGFLSYAVSLTMVSPPFLRAPCRTRV